MHQAGRGLHKLVPGLPKRNSAARTPLLLANPKFAWPFDWPTHMKIPRTVQLTNNLLDNSSEKRPKVNYKCQCASS